LEATQPGSLPADDDHERFASDIRDAISKVGAAHAFKHGLTVNSKHVRLSGFKPQFQATQDSLHNDYRHNRFTVIRELEFNSLRQRLDVGLFLNGIPLFTFELKSELSSQTVADAMEQYRRDRDPATSVLLQPVIGALAHFAVSQDDAAFTTHLQGADTAFLPFNPGYGYMRPEYHAYKTDYLWQEVLTPDKVLELLEYFIYQKVGPDGLEVLFPRFHQWDCIQKLRADVTANGTGQRYLQQHSAGSGKSNTISWLTFQLAFLMVEGQRKVFDKVIVVTDRLVLDRQLGDVLAFMQGSEVGQLVKCQKTRDLIEALQSKIPVVLTTIQKFAWLQKVLDQDPNVQVDPGVWTRIRGLRFAIVIDEAHSSQGGELFLQMLQYLTAHRKSGRVAPNVSFFAFTATPRLETLEIFGSKNRMGELEPFHSYSMRQAIDEGYILDVR
jgi:type I restriction enzyme R subunit